MTYTEFTDSLNLKEPPEMQIVLQSLWYDAKGDWASAHDLISTSETPENNRIHAYLHRKEGDTGNAAYWYAKAQMQPPQCSFAEEWEDLVRMFISRR